MEFEGGERRVSNPKLIKREYSFNVFRHLRYFVLSHIQLALLSPSDLSRLMACRISADILSIPVSGFVC